MTKELAFPEALQALLTKRGWSHRGLSAKLVEEFGDGGWNEHKGMKHTSVSRLVRGTMHPTRLAMERIAKVMRVDPDDVFLEYRLEVVRDELNWREVGTARALEALRELTGDEE